MARVIVPAADALLDIPVPIYGDGIGEVVPLDYMGGDVRIVEAARTSYQGGTKTVNEDRGLIQHLMRNAHTSPFEQVILLWYMRIPLFVAVQLVRHRTARLNAESGRYSVMENKFCLPTLDGVRGQGDKDKQVGDGKLVEGNAVEALKLLNDACNEAYEKYENLLTLGVAREQARMVLPQNLYVKWYWQMDLHNWFHMAGLRLDWHAQLECRQAVAAQVPLVKAVAPMAFDAWETEVFDSIRLSGRERALVKSWLDTDWNPGDLATNADNVLGHKSGQRLMDKLAMLHRAA
jgi:thymidylate synthase (FAD)